jgi:hypothetical protein
MLWVEVLNCSLEWRDPFRVARWMQREAAVVLEPAMHSRLLRDEGLVRRSFAASYLGVEPPAEDQALLSQWLAAVTLRPEPLVPWPPLLNGTGPPRLLVRRSRGLPEPFEALLSTALLQLLTWQDGGQESAVHRCHGVVRGAAGDDGIPPDWSRRFAEIAGLGDLLDEGPVHQCQRLLVAPRGGHFCSKSCSNAHFVVRKAASDPRYFADKQGRYRRRRQRPAPRRDQGALVFMD